MTSLEMAIRLMVSRLERKLWDTATAIDIPAPNGDIIGSAVKGYHRVNNGFIKYTLKDYERGVTIYPSFAVMIMDGERLALFIKMTFNQSSEAAIHELGIASITINGKIISLDDIDSDSRNSRDAENMIMSLIINNL